jgi:hypothetical protein
VLGASTNQLLCAEFLQQIKNQKSTWTISPAPPRKVEEEVAADMIKMAEEGETLSPADVEAIIVPVKTATNADEAQGDTGIVPLSNKSIPKTTSKVRLRTEAYTMSQEYVHFILMTPLICCSVQVHRTGTSS